MQAKQGGGGGGGSLLLGRHRHHQNQIYSLDAFIDEPNMNLISSSYRSVSYFISPPPQKKQASLCLPVIVNQFITTDRNNNNVPKGQILSNVNENRPIFIKKKRIVRRIKTNCSASLTTLVLNSAPTARQGTGSPASSLQF